MKVVLLHPLPLDSSMWSEEIRNLGQTVLAPDLYELGNSLESWASRVLELAGSGPLVLIGNSVGGSCAVEIARLVPDRVRLLVLIGAKPGHRPDPAFRDAAVELLSEHGMAKGWPTYWEPLFGPNVDPLVLEAARNIAFAQDVDQIIRGVRVFHGRADRSSFLENLDVPVLMVNGEHDPIFAKGDRLASNLRSGALSVVMGAGHYVPIEQPQLLLSIIQQAMSAL